MTGAVLQRPAVGPIEPTILYPLADFQARSGMGAAAMRTARANGLKVRYAGSRGYVLGADFISWVEASGRDQK